MKKIIITIVVCFLCQQIKAQAANAAATQLANHIAQKMKDTLNLTQAQRNQVYDVNLLLHNQKQQARTQNTGTPQQLTLQIQNIEKTRDSLYQPILTAPQYELYRQKKRNLVTNN
jgi:archaellum component FlaG (FlaF/FlaG flagellin family)